MPYVIKIDRLITGGRSPYDGLYLMEYDPTVHLPSGAYDGGVVVVTHDANIAKHFDSQMEALEYWRTPTGCKCHGVLGNLRVNRPLTAWSIDILAHELVARAKG